MLQSVHTQKHALIRPRAGGIDDGLLSVERHDRLRIPVEYYAITAISLSTTRLCLRYVWRLLVVTMAFSTSIWLHTELESVSPP